MGNLCGCCCKESSSYEDLTPDLETRRRMQREAAEKRIAEQEERGIKNIEAVKRQRQKALQIEKSEQEAANMGGQSKLKWQVN